MVVFNERDGVVGCWYSLRLHGVIAFKSIEAKHIYGCQKSSAHCIS